MFEKKNKLRVKHHLAARVVKKPFYLSNKKHRKSITKIAIFVFSFNLKNQIRPEIYATKIKT